MNNIVVTGGLGYIGSHIVKALVDWAINKSTSITIIDNLSNSDIERFNQVLQPYADSQNVNMVFIGADITDDKFVPNTIIKLKGHTTVAIIHCAGLKSVAESEMPEKQELYHHTNVHGTWNVAKLGASLMARIIFSSSATVYGDQGAPFKEDAPLSPTNFYGVTKKKAEELLESWARLAVNPTISLRYFNPVGAECEALSLAEIPSKPTNLMPLLCQAAYKNRPINIYGTDYNTPDGTALRDYIDVRDVARAHLLVLERLLGHKAESLGIPLYEVFNIGTGTPVSVRELITAFNENAASVNVVEAERRAGDAEVVYADVNKARYVLGFKAELTIGSSCKSAYLAFLNCCEHQNGSTSYTHRCAEAISSFLTSNATNTWTTVEDMEVYVRKSKRVVSGKTVQCFDIANVNIAPHAQRQGNFTRLFETCKLLAKAFGYEAILIENVMNTGFANALTKKGFIESRDDGMTPSFMFMLKGDGDV